MEQLIGHLSQIVVGSLWALPKRRQTFSARICALEETFSDLSDATSDSIYKPFEFNQKFQRRRTLGKRLTPYRRVRRF